MTFAERDRINNEPTMYILVGLSRTGKSTWANANRLRLDAVIFSRDDFRRACGVEYHIPIEPLVTVAHEYAVRALLHRGMNVIIDDTNLTEKYRDHWFQLAHRIGAHVCIVEVTLPKDLLRWQELCVRDGFLWETISRQFDSYEAVRPHEKIGFKEYREIPNLVDRRSDRDPDNPRPDQVESHAGTTAPG